MDPLLVFFGGFALVLLLVAMACGLWHPRTGMQIVGRILHSEEAQAEIEAHDIDQMLDGLNARRRAAGRRDLGEELAKQLEPHLRDG